MRSHAKSFLGANDGFQVHAFPFRMTQANMDRYAKHEAYPFWLTLKEGYDFFELTRTLPTVAVCNRRYVVNVMLPGGDPSRLNPEAACPTFYRPKPDPFKPRPGEQFAEQRITMPGAKMRGLANVDDGGRRAGLTSSTGATGFGYASPDGFSMSLVPVR